MQDNPLAGLTRSDRAWASRQAIAAEAEEKLARECTFKPQLLARPGTPRSADENADPVLLGQAIHLKAAVPSSMILCNVQTHQIWALIYVKSKGCCLLLACRVGASYENVGMTSGSSMQQEGGGTSSGLMRRLAAHRERRTAELEAQRAQRSAAELAQCTFAPALAPRPEAPQVRRPLPHRSLAGACHRMQHPPWHDLCLPSRSKLCLTAVAVPELHILQLQASEVLICLQHARARPAQERVNAGFESLWAALKSG